MILYHRTDAASAAAIAATGSWTSAENTGEVYFSNRRNGQAVGYGDAVVRVTVADGQAHLDDEFPGGERHYRVHRSALEGQPVSILLPGRRAT